MLQLRTSETYGSWEVTLQDARLDLRWGSWVVLEIRELETWHNSLRAPSDGPSHAEFKFGFPLFMETGFRKPFGDLEKFRNLFGRHFGASNGHKATIAFHWRFGTVFCSIQPPASSCSYLQNRRVSTCTVRDVRNYGGAIDSPGRPKSLYNFGRISF